ncbi:MAG: hypothetical protein M8349_06320 [ANME-2 cluster archaeon]|nr:hypothetical protein [ANME-2 cluster archaeon]
MFATLMLELVMFVPAMAYAETPRDSYQVAQDKYQTYTNRVEDAKKTYQDSRESFLDAKDRFNDVRSRENIVTLKQSTKDYLNHTIDYTMRRLESLKIRAEIAEENGYAPFTASENVQGYIDDLEDLRDDVAAAETREDFQAVI